MNPMGDLELLIRIKRLFALKNYSFFKGVYNVNLIGVRSASRIPNKFDDTMLLIYQDYLNRVIVHRWNITTDPGLYYLLQPCNIQGTAILMPGQYRSAFKLGQHKGHSALEQHLPVTVIRDTNRDNILDFDEQKSETGFFGIQIHRAWEFGSKDVGKWSAGCQVFAEPVEFDIFYRICFESTRKWGENLTYTLINENDLNSIILAENRGKQ